MQIVRTNVEHSLLCSAKTCIYKDYIKRPIDFILALFAIIVLSPVLLTVAVLVRIKLSMA